MSCPSTHQPAICANLSLALATAQKWMDECQFVPLQLGETVEVPWPGTSCYKGTVPAIAYNGSDSGCIRNDDNF